MKHLAVPRNYALHVSAPPPPIINRMASAHILKFRLFSLYAVNHSALSMIGGGSQWREDHGISLSAEIELV